jgi:hypothetical protein
MDLSLSNKDKGLQGLIFQPLNPEPLNPVIPIPDPPVPIAWICGAAADIRRLIFPRILPQLGGINDTGIAFEVNITENSTVNAKVDGQ